MKAYHITTKTAAMNIRKTGFSLKFSGTEGGNLLEDAVYFSLNPEYWEHKLNIQEPEILEVEIDMDNIIVDLDTQDCISVMIASQVAGGGNENCHCHQ